MRCLNAACLEGFYKVNRRYMRCLNLVPDSWHPGFFSYVTEEVEVSSDLEREGISIFYRNLRNGLFLFL